MPVSVSKIIDSLKLSSSIGVGASSSKVSKNAIIILSYLYLIFFQSLATGVVPVDWRIGEIITIFLKGDKHSPLNYRPISLTSVPAKTMEHIIHSNLARFLQSSSLFNPPQHGFHNGFSSESQLVTFVHDIQLNLDANS